MTHVFYRKNARSTKNHRNINFHEMFIINYNSIFTEPHSFSSFNQLQFFCSKTFNVSNFDLFYQDTLIKNDNDFRMLNDVLEFSLEPLKIDLKPSFYQNRTDSHQNQQIQSSQSNLPQFNLQQFNLQNTIQPLSPPSNQLISNFYCSANLKISTWKVLKKIGTGAFGQVYLALNKKDNQCWAVKTSRHEKSDAVKQIKNEVELLKSISHPNVIQYIAFEFDKSREVATAFMAMEYLPKGSLHDEIKRTGPLRLESARSYGKQVLAALIYIHGKSIIHRDIKCGNGKVVENEENT